MKIFRALVVYLKFMTIFMLIMSVVGGVIRSFDPTYYIQTLLSQHLFGSDAFPPDGQKTFDFVFLLFSIASIGMSITQFYLVHYGIAKRILWTHRAVLWFWLVWVFVGGVWYWIEGYNFYVINSVSLMLLLFVVPLLWVGRYMEK